MLTLFPNETLAASVTTTIWVGVWVVVFFNLRLGWSASGLVVPGYLVPLLIAKPLSAGVILLESIITYFVVRLLSEPPGRRRWWSSFFGRDRFFALILVSVLVRALLDGWLLPWMAPRINEWYGINIDYRNHLHSYGLVIVALTANYFWKPGVIRGILPLVITIATTYLLVRYLLIEWTNFNVGNLQYVYEDIASSLLASPKAYVILITTALLASWLNLRYGWEFNGILLPALLALQWHDPLKILASLGEALIIFTIGSLLLKLPLFRRTTMEGSRKVLLFFNLTFLYRVALGWTIPLYFPGMKVSDLYGFGYLLSTLLAIRAHDQNLAVRISRVTVQVSILGAVAGSLVGFLLTFCPDAWYLPTVDTASVSAESTPKIEKGLAEVVWADRLSLYENCRPGTCKNPLAPDIKRFEDGLERLMDYTASQEPEKLAMARARLAEVNYAVHLVDDRYLYLREYSPSRGWGRYILDLNTPDGLLIEVPAPLEEWGSTQAGLALFQTLEAKALAIAGTGRRVNHDGTSDVLTDANTLFAVFHRVVGLGNTLQVRGDRQLRSSARNTNQPAPTRSSLWTKRSLPAGLNLQLLKDQLDGLEIHWEPAPESNVLRANMWSGMGELLLSRGDRRKLLLAHAPKPNTPESPLNLTTGRLRDRLLNTKLEMADRGTNRYRPAKQEEMLYFDREVVRPLLRIVGRVPSVDRLATADREELEALAMAAAVLNYQVVLFEDQITRQGYLLLAEFDDPLNRCYWGTYVFRFGLAGAQIIEIPRPMSERYVLEFGSALFEQVAASALLIAGAHPQANLDGSADVMRMANKLSAFNLVHQVLLREMGPRPMLVAQVRAIREPTDSDIVLAADDGATKPAELSPLKQTLFDLFDHDGLHIGFVDGSPGTAGYGLGVTLQSVSLTQTQNKELLSVWLSPALRTTYRQQSENRLQESQFLALGIARIEADLHDYLDRLGTALPQYPVSDEMKRRFAAYLANRDIIHLRELQHSTGNRLVRLIDRDSRQAFLLIRPENPNELPAVANLADTVSSKPTVVVSRGFKRKNTQRFINSRATWLEVRADP